jgi:hypothetical protein
MASQKKDVETLIRRLKDIDIRFAAQKYPKMIDVHKITVEWFAAKRSFFENSLPEIVGFLPAELQLEGAEIVRESIREVIRQMSAAESASTSAFFAIDSVLRAVAVGRARAGDPQLAIDYVEGGFPITEELRPLLVQALKGELKRPNNRPAKLETSWRNTQMGSRVHEMHKQGIKIESAVAQVAEEYGVSGQTVRRALRQYRLHVGRFESALARTREEYDKRARQRRDARPLKH